MEQFRQQVRAYVQQQAAHAEQQAARAEQQAAQQAARAEQQAVHAEQQAARAQQQAAQQAARAEQQAAYAEQQAARAQQQAAQQAARAEQQAARAQQQAGQSGHTEGGTTWSFTSGSICFYYLNGYGIRTNGMSLFKDFVPSNVNGQINIEVYTREPDKVEVTKSEDTLKFEIVNGGIVIQLLTITPPSSTSIDDIQYETKDGKLRIWA